MIFNFNFSFSFRIVVDGVMSLFFWVKIIGVVEVVGEFFNSLLRVGLEVVCRVVIVVVVVMEEVEVLGESVIIVERLVIL